MENITDKVTHKKRIRQFFHDKTFTESLELVAELVEMAYLAGTQRLSCDNLPKLHQERAVTIGENVVAAKNYVKDKGLRL